ncbi:DUF551 domain-containing protein [Klebsiella aerogenes]
MTNNQLTREKVKWLHDAAEEAAAVGIKLTMNPSELLMFTSELLAVNDSDPVAWTDEEELRDANENGSGYLFGIGHDANKFADPRRQIMLYRHAQPAPVVPDAATAIRACLSEFPESARDIVEECADIAENACRSSMFQAEPVTTANKLGNSPVIPDGYVMVPMRLTAENGAKGALSFGFSETKFVNCPECFGDDECETCDGSGRIEITVPVTWTTIKDIWAKGVEHFAAVPQSPGSELATVPGKWIPVSERMPENDVSVLTFDGMYKRVHHAMYGHWQCWEPEKITHWMPLPATPQEVKP